MRRPAAVGAIAAIFLLGMLTGVFASHLFILHQIHGPGGLAAFGTRLMAADLKRRLDLTPEQQAKVDAILADTRNDIQAVRHECLPRTTAILDRAQARIEQLLDPEQKKEFARFHQTRAGRLRKLLLGGH
ncbi:MAG: hypothetical protein M3O15_06445 [Acidobacteriota bacterium]|nr:hypothetical protein [Acidobacteriota bacterium]